MKNLLINRALAAKKKKLFTLLLAVAASVGTMFAWDYERVQIGDLYYNLDATNRTAEVTSQDSSFPYWSTTITTANIPSSVTYNSKTYSVTSIGNYAFCGCYGLTSVTIPNSVTSIGEWAFGGCYSLTSVVWNAKNCSACNFGSQVESFTFGDEVEVIPSYICRGMTKLTSVTIGNSVTSIGSYAFDGCSGLTSVVWNAKNCSACNFGSQVESFTFGDEVEVIPSYICRGMTKLTSVTIPNSVTSIGYGAFDGCTGLTSPVYNAHVFAFMPSNYEGAYTIPAGIESIAGGAFYGCSGLTSVTIGNSVTSIGSRAFKGCTGLTSVTIGNSVTSIGDGAFEYCSGLTSPVYNAHVFVIMPTSYSGAYTIPNGIESIANGAFSGCSSLTSVTIPNSVTSIGGSAFYYCSGLTSVTIPNSVTSIGSGAFYDCTGLTSVTIPNSVTSIGSEAFRGCSGLTSVTIEAETPPTSDGSAFSNTKNFSIYVPCGTLDSYKTAEGWSMYKYQIKYAPYSSYTINKKAENGNITTSSTDFTMCDTEHPVICTANPNRGCYFVRWADGNTENPRTIELSQDTTMEAIFDYLLTGKCGKDSALAWTFEPASMALNITGSGALSKNYTYGTFIESLTIGNEITSIGERAFEYCSGLTSVTIGNSVTSIGSGAFLWCANLKNVIIGSSVKVLEESAFYRCSAIETITCYGQRPPTVNTNALYGLPYSTIVYVPKDYLETYTMHDAWGLYDVRPLGASGTETDKVKVEPAETTATVAWPTISGAGSYELVIRDKDGNALCTLVFNAQGQLTSIDFAAAPARDRSNIAAMAQGAGFAFTVTGLESGTMYKYSFITKNASGTVIDTKTGAFTTQSPTALEDIMDNASSSTSVRKVLQNGRLYILHDGKVYNATGAEVK